MSRVIFTVLGLAMATCEGLAAEPATAKDPVVAIHETPSGIRFGLWPKKPDKPAPTLIILALDVESTLGQPVYRRCGNALAEQGFLCVSIDLPAHGPDKREDEPEGLAGWRTRADRDEDFVADLVRRVQDVLTHLIAAGWTDPERVVACGTSRGGYAALQLAAAEPRVKCVAAFAPVTDLRRLREFSGTEQSALVERLSLIHQADKLAGRPVWIIIGDQDMRVGTDDAIAFARAVSRESAAQKRPSRMELIVTGDGRGHAVPEESAGDAAKWILRELAESESGPP